MCTTFLENSYCKTKEEEEKQTEDSNIINKNSGIGILGIICIVLIVTMIMLITIYCYKRIVNKTLDQSIGEKIQNEAINSIGNYTSFSEKN